MSDQEIVAKLRVNALRSADKAAHIFDDAADEILALRAELEHAHNICSAVKRLHNDAYYMALVEVQNQAQPPEPVKCIVCGVPHRASPFQCYGGKFHDFSKPTIEPVVSDAMAGAGMNCLDDRGFRIGMSDLGLDDFKAVFLAMLQAKEQ